MVLKFYHGHASRPAEHEFVARALAAAMDRKGDDAEEIRAAIFGHLPEVIAAASYAEEMNTKDIRVDLKARHTDDRHTRFLTVVVSLELNPITDVPLEQFLQVFLDCIRCEYPPSMTDLPIYRGPMFNRF